MPRKCTICQHPQRAAIDAALVAGGVFRTIAHGFACSEDALKRHKADHLPALLTHAQQAADVAKADSLLAQVRDLQKRALDILDQAEGAGDLRAATSAIREARGCIELLAKLMGELDERATVNIVLAPEWVHLRGRILLALEPYPEARLAIVGALDAEH